ncbi:hypothetical protein V6N11_018659 [Hibiscus sabdariffa]|uniref:Uncharacterized protein n=1 Tax=Hibiscus sabdariffa TaxID=183260 RepID=A0ABR2QSX3_9ROSI
MEVNASESLVFATSKAALPDSQPLEEMIILETSVVLERKISDSVSNKGNGSPKPSFRDKLMGDRFVSPPAHSIRVLDVEAWFQGLRLWNVTEVVKRIVEVPTKAIGNKRAERSDQGTLRVKTTGQVINQKLSQVLAIIVGSNHSVGTCPIDPPALIGIPQVAPKDTIVNIAPSLSQEKHSTIEVIERKEDQVLKEKNGRVLPNSIKGTGGKITTK